MSFNCINECGQWSQKSMAIGPDFSNQNTAYVSAITLCQHGTVSSGGKFSHSTRSCVYGATITDNNQAYNRRAASFEYPANITNECPRGAITWNYDGPITGWTQVGWYGIQAFPPGCAEGSSPVIPTNHPTTGDNLPLYNARKTTCCECNYGKAEFVRINENSPWQLQSLNCTEGREVLNMESRVSIGNNKIEFCCDCECGETTFTFHGPILPTSFGSCDWMWSSQNHRWLKSADNCINNGIPVAPTGFPPPTSGTLPCDSPYGHCQYKWVTNDSEWVLLYDGCRQGGTPVEPPVGNPQNFRTYKTTCTPPDVAGGSWRFKDLNGNSGVNCDEEANRPSTPNAEYGDENGDTKVLCCENCPSTSMLSPTPAKLTPFWNF